MYSNIYCWAKGKLVPNRIEDGCWDSGAAAAHSFCVAPGLTLFPPPHRTTVEWSIIPRRTSPLGSSGRRNSIKSSDTCKIKKKISTDTKKNNIYCFPCVDFRYRRRAFHNSLLHSRSRVSVVPRPITIISSASALSFSSFNEQYIKHKNGHCGTETTNE